jgi:hypothetical protein
MKKYTFEELKTMNDEELRNVAKGIVDGKQNLTKKEKQIVYEEMITYIKRLEHFGRLLTSVKSQNHDISEQFEVLKEAYEAGPRKDWTGCGFALRAFFEYETPDEFMLLMDLSGRDFQYILRWYEMLRNPILCDVPNGSPVRIFSNTMDGQFILIMPQHGKSKLREGLKKFFPEAHSLLEKSTVYTEDGEKCLTISGGFLLSENQTHKLQ